MEVSITSKVLKWGDLQTCLESVDGKCQQLHGHLQERIYIILVYF
jgi:hypothetical protein